MGNAYQSIENGGLAHDYVLGAAFQRIFYPLDALKPDQFYRTRAIGEVGMKSFGSSRRGGMDVVDDTAEYDLRVLDVYLIHGSDFCAVDIPIWEIEQKVLESIHFQLALQHGSLGRANAFKESYVSFEQSHFE